MPFPAGFLFGAAVSAHQVEGDNANSDWWYFEQENAPRWAKRDRHTHYGQEALSPEAWARFGPEIQNPATYLSGRSADHYNRYEEDIKLAAKLGLNTFRFSIEWARIEPEPGLYDEEAIAHYADVVRSCRKHGLEPFVTLWHFTLPVWAGRMGGWANPTVIERYVAYATLMADRLADEVKFLGTMNEPWVYVQLGYVYGVWPHHGRAPQRQIHTVSRNLIKAHTRAYEEIKRAHPHLQVGVSLDAGHYSVKRSTMLLLSWLVARFTKRFGYEYFLRGMAKASDWLGLQYYIHYKVAGTRLVSEPGPHSDLGWGLYPRGHYRLLRRFARYGKPLYITESGLADADDTHRAWYIRETLGYVERALDEGIDVRGYMHWSLLDNFEWDKGFWPRFGLYEVDFKTFERKARPSTAIYTAIIKAGTAREEGDLRQPRIRPGT